VNKDPSGKCIEDACVGEAILTAPIWGPTVIAGATAAGVSLYYGASALLRGRSEPRWAGTVPTLSPTELGFGSPPTGPEDMIPNLKPNLPKWIPLTVVGMFVVNEAKEFYDQYNGVKDSTQQMKSATPSSGSSKNSGTFIQTSPSTNVQKQISSQSSNSLRSTLNQLSGALSQISKMLSSLTSKK
jgi:hypothetical protein